MTLYAGIVPVLKNNTKQVSRNTTLCPALKYREVLVMDGIYWKRSKLDPLHLYSHLFLTVRSWRKRRRGAVYTNSMQRHEQMQIFRRQRRQRGCLKQRGANDPLKYLQHIIYGQHTHEREQKTGACWDTLLCYGTRLSPPRQRVFTFSTYQ